MLPFKDGEIYMDIQTILDFIINNGIAVAVVGYFLWKDSKLTKENTEILEEVKTLLLVLTDERMRHNE